MDETPPRRREGLKCSDDDVVGTSTMGARRGVLRGLEPPPLNGNHLNTNLLLTFVKTKNSTHAYIAI